jgi:DNA-binding transcriptional MerR regulator
MKRRGNRRYYQHHEVLMIRRIRELLYDQGFTISGARNRLQEQAQAQPDTAPDPAPAEEAATDAAALAREPLEPDELHRQLKEIRALLVFD